MSRIVVQHVCTGWTKAARGGEMAAKRNAVPNVVKIPVKNRVDAGAQLLHHTVSYGEYNGFLSPRQELTFEPTMHPLRFGCVTVALNTDGVIMMFCYDRGQGGAPNRSWAQQTFHIKEGEWAQMAHNGRFQYSDDGQWYYKMIVVNVGLVEAVTPGMFTGSTPTYRFAAMGHLY